MKMFAWWFEARLAACPETKTYTLDPRGLSVPGIVAAAPQELLRRPPLGARKADFLSAAATAHSTLSSSQLGLLGKLTDSFPREEFLQEYPFLSEYL